MWILSDDFYYQADMNAIRSYERNEGRVEGKAESIIEIGLDLGLSEDEILRRLQNKLNLSLQKAQEYFEMFSKQTVLNFLR